MNLCRGSSVIIKERYTPNSIRISSLSMKHDIWSMFHRPQYVIGKGKIRNVRMSSQDLCFWEAIPRTAEVYKKYVKGNVPLIDL